MARTVHLLKAAVDDLALATMRRQAEAGERVIAVFLEGAEAACPLPDGVSAHRVPTDLDYAQLLDMIFGADRVIAW